MTAVAASIRLADRLWRMLSGLPHDGCGAASACSWGFQAVTVEGLGTAVLLEANSTAPAMGHQFAAVVVAAAGVLCAQQGVMMGQASRNAAAAAGFPWRQLCCCMDGMPSAGAYSCIAAGVRS